MGLNPYATGGKKPVAAGTHLDAQGNLVDDATGAIIQTAAQLAQGQNADQAVPTHDSGGAWGDIRDAATSNPATAVLPATYDLVTGHPADALGDVVAGATLNQFGTGRDIGNDIGKVPDAVRLAAGAAGNGIKDAAGAVVDAAGDLVTPATADSSGLNAIRDKAIANQDQLNGKFNTLDANPTVAPQSDLVQLDQTNIDPLRQRQGTALDQLQAAANGTVPSAAEILGRDQANRAAAQAYGNAAALQGGQSSGGALRQALDAQTQIQGDANTQLIAARAKEMSDARNQLVTGVGNARGQESTDATTNANLDQNRNLANTQASLTTHGQDVTEKGDLVNAQNTALNTASNTEKAKVDADTAAAASKNLLKGAEINGAASVIPKLVSDRRAKTNIHEANLVQLAEDAPGYTFDYKDVKDGPGRRVSVMAQDVQRSRMGKDLVQMGDDGDLVLDGANSLGAALAMSAKALRDTEALKKRRK